MLSNFHILTVSHKETSLEELPSYALHAENESSLQVALTQLKERLGMDELLYLNTCNRILYFFVTQREVDHAFVSQVFGESVDHNVILYKQDSECLSYMLHVASSLHSMVVGEREILKQIKVAYDQQSQWGLPSDNIRLVIEHTIRGAKRVYQETSISERPISVVSLAVRKLSEFVLTKDAKFVLVGAGATIRLMLKHLTKKGFSHFIIYNRTLEKAQRLAQSVSLEAGLLTDLAKHNTPFDCLIACTSATDPIVTHDLAKRISGNKIADKIWIDLGMPGDIERGVLNESSNRSIDLQTLQKVARENLEVRLGETQKAETILELSLTSLSEALYRRKIERAFQVIPSEIKSIKQRAYAEVFQKELEAMDEDTQALIYRMMDYMEKKCIGIPMKAAKEAIL